MSESDRQGVPVPTSRGGRRPGAGRPRVTERLERVSTRVPVENFEELRQLAHKCDTSIAELVRQGAALVVIQLK